METQRLGLGGLTDAHLARLGAGQITQSELARQLGITRQTLSVALKKRRQKQAVPEAPAPAPRMQPTPVEPEPDDEDWNPLSPQLRRQIIGNMASVGVRALQEIAVAFSRAAPGDMGPTHLNALIRAYRNVADVIAPFVCAPTDSDSAEGLTKMVIQIMAADEDAQVRQASEQAYQDQGFAPIPAPADDDDHDKPATVATAPATRPTPPVMALRTRVPNLPDREDFQAWLEGRLAAGGRRHLRDIGSALGLDLGIGSDPGEVMDGIIHATGGDPAKLADVLHVDSAR